MYFAKKLIPGAKRPRVGSIRVKRGRFLFLCYVYIIPAAATMEDTDLNRIINKLKLSTKEPQLQK